MTADIQTYPAGSDRLALLRDPVIRGLIIQILMIIGLLAFFAWIINNTVSNLQDARIASGFGFLGSRSGFDIGQLPIDYSSNSTYGRALLVGAVNTIIVAGCGIVAATIIGFIVGIGRLSRNYLARGLCTVYVETFRNIPPLLVILFWYFGVLSVLPLPREAIELPFGAFMSNRGLQTPSTVFEAIALFTLIALVVGVVASIVLARINKAHQMKTGERRPTLWPVLGLVIGLPVVVFIVTGLPVSFEFPEATRFNLVGGWQVKPEFLALFLALSVYTAAFVAEIVRAGILSVSKGQTEASSALGLTRGQALRLVIIPQAFRVIIPPLTSQYLNLTKNTSLGLAVGYPELVAVGSTVLNQTGQSVEVVMVWMVVYLGLSITVATFMNWFNARMALVER